MQYSDLIAYYQKRPGRRKPYGLDVHQQRANIDRFITERNERDAREAAEEGREPYVYRVIAEYTEIVDHTMRERPELDAALDECIRRDAVLLIGTRYRLKRNVEFLKRLRDSLFAVADDPELTAGTLAMHLSEATDWSREQGNAIRAAMPRDIKYGWARKDHADPAIREAARKKATSASVEKRQDRMQRAYGPLLPRIRKMREHDEAYHKIATVLNEMGCVTIAGMPFTATAVHRIDTEYDLD